MRRPGLAVANSFANGRKCVTEQVFPLSWHGLLALGPSAWTTNAPHCVQRAGFSQKLVVRAKIGDLALDGVCVNLA